MRDTDETNVRSATSPEKKREAIRRVLEGEDVDAVARTLGMDEATVEELVGKFLLARQREPKGPTWEERRRSRFRNYNTKTMSEIDFPEMMEPIPKEYLRKLKPERAKELMEKQATAQEKVGYERYAPKYFLPIEEDPFPEDRREKAPPILSVREIIILLAGFFGGIGVYAGFIASGANFEKLGFMPVVLAIAISLALFAASIRQE